MLHQAEEMTLAKLRIGNDDRAEAMDLVTTASVRGFLDADEAEKRSQEVMAAVYVEDLLAATGELPSELRWITLKVPEAPPKPRPKLRQLRPSETTKGVLLAVLVLCLLRLLFPIFAAFAMLIGGLLLMTAYFMGREDYKGWDTGIFAVWGIVVFSLGLGIGVASW